LKNTNRSEISQRSEISLDTGPERKTQNPAGVDSGTPDPVPPMVYTS